MKKAARRTIEKALWFQVRRLLKKHDVKIIAVAGSIGKTSTKLAISRVLEEKFKVQYQEGNYNVPVSVPLVFFGQTMPALFNPLAWLRIFIKNELLLHQKYPYEAVVVELGTDAPGQLEEFIPLLAADIGVLTSIAPEHMEYFKTMEAVAEEELMITKVSKMLIFNKDLCSPDYMRGIKGFSYGIQESADLKLEKLQLNGTFSFEANLNGQSFLTAKVGLISLQQLYSVAGAILTAYQLGMNPEEIKQGLLKIKPVSGRMQKLEGVNGSIIIDDTYNASPKAVIAALNTLYELKAPHKIAVLGNMNELGEYTEQAHAEVGRYCDPKQISLLVTIGPDANTYLAKAAEDNGCKVISFDDPYTAGRYLKPIVREGYLVLIKGSQNKVFAEEVVKELLGDPKDVSKLVRQSDYWMKRKRKNLGIKQ